MLLQLNPWYWDQSAAGNPPERPFLALLQEMAECLKQAAFPPVLIKLFSHEWSKILLHDLLYCFV